MSKKTVKIFELIWMSMQTKQKEVKNERFLMSKSQLFLLKHSFF